MIDFSTTIRRVRAALLLWLLVALATSSGPLAAQPSGPALVTWLLPVWSEQVPQLRLLVPPSAPAAGRMWLEITPLEDESPAAVYRLRGTTEQMPVPGLRAGAVMVCIGLEARAVHCQERYLEPGTPVSATWAPGVAVVGRYQRDDQPLAAARVAVVPAGLSSRRPYLMPLGLAGGSSRGLVRAVWTDDEGHFRLPELAPGTYRLETEMPDGRLHSGAPFELPAATAGRTVVDLGTIAVRSGLALAVRVVDDRGEPVPGAEVVARQGARARDLLSARARADGEGLARLGGFEVEQGVRVDCQAEDHVSARIALALVPVVATCVLVRQARLAGAVIGPDGAAPAGVFAALLAVPETPAAALAQAAGKRPQALAPTPAMVVQRQTMVASGGAFALRAIDPGTYRLRLVAPGFAAEQRVLEILPGERLDLGVIALGAASALDGVVVDAEDGSPLSGVTVGWLEPEGGGTDLTDDEGRFAITDLGTLSAGGARVLEARHPDHVVARFHLPPAAERAADEPLRIALRRGGSILVVVWDAASGRACRGCAVRIDPGALALRTDGRGEALSELLVPGRYRVALSRMVHLGSTVVEEPEAEVRWVHVYAEGIAPVWFGERTQAVRVRFRPQPEAHWLLVARSRRRAQRVFADADGAFTLEQERDEGLGLYLLGWDAEAEATVEVRQARLAPADHAREVVLGLPSGRLLGQVTSEGRPVAGVRIRLRGLHDGQRVALAATDAGGRFRVPHLPAGVYALEVGQRPLRFVRISPGERVDIGTWDLLAGSF